LVAVAVAFLCWPIEVAADDADDADAPQLVVLVVFDQMRGDYLKRWESLYCEGGFKRLMKEGAWFTNCHHAYASTLTAPGHAALATGCSPDKSGIVANDWYSRADATTVAAVTPPPDQERLGPGPYRRRQPTFGDSLLGARPKAKVVSLSIKDRVAILLAALRAQACYWFDTKTGHFVTSRFYRDEPHTWVKQFNQEKPADAWLGKSWQRLRPDLDYVKYSGPDDVAAEGTGYEQGVTFPHPFLKGKDAKKPTYYDAVTNSPAGSELLLALASRALDAEQLGRRGVTDLLCLGFSSNDLIGHSWGPDSQEVLDITLRSDLVMKELLDTLDAKVGKGRYVIGLAADHGICPLPELSLAQGKDAGRVPVELLTSLAEAFLNEHFLPPGRKETWFEMPKKINTWVYFNQATLRTLGVPQPDAERALADWLVKQQGVQAAFTRTELLKAPLTDPIGRMVQRSFHPDASGDVLVVLKPYYVLSQPISSPKTAAYRTTHGSPHPYDTQVPLIVMGPQIVPGVRTERVTPQAMASILARAMGVPPPTGAEASVPEGLFR
jgi:predicted AlkP superfamily pyrophosphatase or phosphodiesterase